MFSDNALKRLIIPLVIEQTLVMLVGMADTLMVSYAGEAAISGVALVDMFEYMIITILTSVSAGGAVIISQYLGGGDEENAGLSASQLMTISIFDFRRNIGSLPGVSQTDTESFLQRCGSRGHVGG